MKQKLREITFIEQIDNPDLQTSASIGGGKVARLVDGRPNPLNVEDDGPWLVIRGKHRTVLVPRTNVACAVLAEGPAAPAKAAK